MVLESLMSPFKMEQHPRRMFLYGLLFASVGVFLGLWVFRSNASLIMVFLATMAALPLIINTIKFEEEKDLQFVSERALIKEHGKALSAFLFLFIGATLAYSFWYVVLPGDTIGVAFDSQTATINAINGRATGFAVSEGVDVFSRIFLNNVKVLIFCILFSFIYGSGAIFILTWNASVIGVAIGNFIRTNISLVADTAGFSSIGHYLQIVSVGVFKYAIHGLPEILAYFMAGLAGGIISVAVIRHDFGSRKFEHVLLDSADLLLLSLAVLFVAALLEVFVTPIIF